MVKYVIKIYTITLLFIFNEFFNIPYIDVHLSATRKLNNWNMSGPNSLTQGPNSQTKIVCCVLEW